MAAMSDKEDTAGPLIGWSLRAGAKRRPIEELQEFPCVFQFKAVGEAGDGFVEDLLARVAQVLGREVAEGEKSLRESARGRYESITLKLPVDDADTLYAIYDAMGSDERVKYLL